MISTQIRINESNPRYLCIEFKDLQDGSYFTDITGELFQKRKVFQVYNYKYNALYCKNGTGCYFEKNDKIYPVNVNISYYYLSAQG